MGDGIREIKYMIHFFEILAAIMEFFMPSAENGSTYEYKKNPILEKRINNSSLNLF